MVHSNMAPCPRTVAYAHCVAVTMSQGALSAFKAASLWLLPHLPSHAATRGAPPTDRLCFHEMPDVSHSSTNSANHTAAVKSNAHANGSPPSN